MRRVVVGGLAAILVALAAGCHPASPSPSPSASPTVLGGPPRRPVPADLVSAQCQQPDGTFHVIGTCAITVGDPKEPEVLVLVSDRTFQVSVPALGASSRRMVEPSPDGTARVGVPVSGPTEVRVACVGAAVCTVSLGDTLPDVSG